MSKLRDKKWKKRGSSNKGQNGITLIALVITIIVLLILAGVSIMMLTGDNSILKNATDAKVSTEEAEVEEAISLAYTTAVSKDYTAGTGKTFAEIFQEELEKNLGEGNVTATGEDGSYIITTNKGNFIMENGKTKKIVEEKVPEEWEVIISSNSGNEWYAYTDITSSTVIAVNVNKPELMGNMKAIKYTGETTGSKWANAMTSDGSMWVWIPRYAYKITKGYHTNTAGTIEIMFLDTNNKPLNGENASTTATETSKKILTDPSQVTYTGDAQNEWLVHPAFTSDASNGGGFGEISGFWFAKFETSGSLTTNTGFKSVAATTSLRSVSIGDFYTYARQQLYGENGSVDSYDRYTSFGQSHIVKNSEWGAVAYLSKSVYGSNDTVVTSNSSNYTTGGSSTTSTVYTTNANQSTTQNAYGVYDMRGGSWEYVASYVNNGHSNLTASSYGAGMNDSTNVATSTKYKTVYVQGSSDGQSANYEANSEMKGDAVWETSSTYSSDTGSWQSACAYFPFSYGPFFGRGGGYYTSYAGVFYFSIYYGSAGDGGSCRLALVP